ncbi:MAG: 2-C-methyl-D-erythritol 2,4-cyclodiphosphate synthase [Gammaproteobacteria bacterium RIFCSPLOWO2_02_FULL_56_15]|nr:MAG: 2-C-methyl-D-erythritol 2,4-cyclodiphosphate synthase [Gammaproteobacteria bacterium RIFCSPLOWO2_02_FULL_56_15]
MRIGHGYDAHVFTTGRPLVLGGVTIPHDQGLKAHSDGDAVIHALCDALLGAASLGDIGRHFPDTDKTYSNIDSRILLRRVKEMLHEHFLSIVNADITILAQAPRMAPHIESMKNVLTTDMGIAVSALNIKAGTTEGMGFVGRREGIAVYAVALLEEC